jgi:pyruvoyl-dependent arginine decarboxylase (PvlArgDC)
MRMAAAVRAARPWAALRGSTAEFVGAGVRDRNAEQFAQPLAAAMLAHRRFVVTDEQFLLALTIRAEEFVKRHGGWQKSKSNEALYDLSRDATHRRSSEEMSAIHDP